MQANFSYSENYFRAEAARRRKPLRVFSLNVGQESCGLLTAAKAKVDVAARRYAANAAGERGFRLVPFG